MKETRDSGIRQKLSAAGIQGVAVTRTQLVEEHTRSGAKNKSFQAHRESVRQLGPPSN